MRRQKRRVIAFVFVFMTVFLCGCTTSKSLYLETDFDDRVKISLDTTDGHDMRFENNVLTISYEDVQQMEGVLLSGEGYEDFLDRLRQDHEFIKEREPFYYEWCEQDGETVFLCPVSPGRAGMILSADKPFEVIRPIVERLSFSTYE